MILNTTKELIKQLQVKHTEYNQSLSVEEYETIGEEDFMVWLQKEISRLEK